MKRASRKAGGFDPAGLILPALILIVWFAVTTWGGIPAYKLPSPQNLL